MRKEYSGLIVAPEYKDDGMMLSHYHWLFHYAIMPEVSPLWIDDEPQCNLTFTEKTLKHIVGLRGEFEVDMWIPHGKDAAWAFNQVFTSYATKKRPR